LSSPSRRTTRSDYTDGDGERRDHGDEGDADDHLGDAGGSGLRHGAEWDAAERHGECRRDFVYSPAAGTVLNAGAGQTLSVTFTPDDASNYTTATATVAITVTKATPTITWATPADLVYGTALSGTQLNATASVAGTFVYSPAAGTVLNAGAGQTLSVTFTPDDASTTRRRRRRSRSR
jgi:hypothetical protein